VWRRALAGGALWVACAMGADFAAAQTNRTWNGSAGSDWFTPANWTPAGVPGANDTVNFTNGTINLTAPVTIGGQLNWSGGTLTGNPLTIATNGVLNVVGGGPVSLYAPLTNAGTINWSNSAAWYVYNNDTASYSGAIYNLSGALLNIQSDQGMYGEYADPFFDNAGTVSKGANTGATTFDLAFTNSGAVIATNGAISFNSGGDLDGTFTAATGASINFSGGTFSYLTPPTVTGPGVVQLNGGSLELVSNTIPNLQLAGGTVTLGTNFQGGTITNLTSGATLNGNFTVSGRFNCGGGVSGSVLVAGGGTLNLTGGTISGNLTVAGGALANWSAGTAGGPVSIATNGVLNVVGGGSVSLYAPLTNAGTINWSNSADWYVYNNNTASYSGAIYNLSGALLNIQNDQGIYGEYADAFFDNAGTVSKGANTGATTFDLAFTNSGAVIATNGAISFNSGGDLDGSFAAAAGASINFSGGTFSYLTPPTVTGPGVVQLTGGSLELVSNTIPNLQLAGGTVTLGSNFQGGTIANLTSGATLNGNFTVSGRFNCGGGVSGSVLVANGGTLSFNGGTISGSLTVAGGALANWSAGNASGPISIATNGVLNVVGSGSVGLYASLTNAGTINWSNSADWYVYNNNTASYSGAIYNLSGALLNIQSDQGIYGEYADAFFDNAGTVSKGANTGATTFDLAFTNSGAVVALAGAINFNSGGDVDGRFTAATNASINFSGGTFSYLTPPTVTGPGVVQLTGGNLELVSNTIPNLQLAGGTVTLGSNFQGGTIANLTSGATLNGNFTVSGLFNCGGGVSGSVLVANGGTLNFNGGTISGNLTVAGGALANWSAGTAGGPVSVATNGVLNLIGGGSVSLYAPLTNAGTINWSNSATWYVYNNNGSYTGAIYNLAGALLNIQSDQSMIGSYPNPFFNNAGTVQKSAAAGTTYISIPFYNSAVLALQSGTIDFNANPAYAQTGATLDFELSSLSSAGHVAIAGNVNFDGTLEVNASGGYVPSIGDALSLVSYGSEGSAFQNLSLPPLGAGQAWQLSYTPSALLLQVVSSAGFSEQISGSVTDNHGQGVTNIGVFAYTTNGTRLYVNGRTDASGNYALGVTNGNWTVGLQGLPARGYNLVPDQFAAISNGNQTVNFVLQPFSGQTFTITTAVNPPGAGTATGGGTFPAGGTVTVSATPITNTLPFLFASWTENGVFESANSSYAFPATRDRQLTANFTLPIYTISVANVPPGAGTVTGAGSYVYGTTNVLTAYPNFGYLFANWTEGASIVGTNSVLTNVVLASHTFVANYAAANLTHVVTTATSPPGLASVAGAGTYTNGQTATFSAPLLVTNPPDIYAFQQFTLSNTLASSANSFNKTFSTLDPTNLQYVAVYAASSILPLLTNVSANYSPLVPSTTNFVLRLQFDRSMRTNAAPLVVLTNSAAALQPVVASNGSWSATVLNNDTYSTPPITIAPGMDGTMQLYVSGAQATNGGTLALTNAAHFTVEATPPPNPALTQVSSNSSSVTVGWSSYNAPADLAGFLVYIQATNYSSAAGLSPLTGLGAGARSYQFTGLSLDTPYYVAVQAVDTAGNSLAALTPLPIVLPSSLPPPVRITVSPAGASSAVVSWNGYSTAGLLGFAGFYVYLEQTDFTSVAGLTPQATLGPSQSSFQANGLDRTKTNYFAVVGFNAANHFNPNVLATAWTDPYAGVIGVNTTIGGSAPSVVPIYQSIVVASNATLTIQPGTTLLFAPGTSLTVAQGSLAAKGTALAPIILDSANDVSGGTPAPGDWGGVTLGSGAGASGLQFVEILYGAGLTLNGCSPSVQALTVNFNTPSGLSLENGATLATASALVSGNQVGVQQSDTAVLSLGGSVIQNNQTNAWAAGSAALNALSNWWGTATQASFAPLLIGNVSYSPFLTSEPVLTPAIGTSNGVTQVGAPSVVLQLACRTATSMRLSEDFTFGGVFFVPFSNYATFPLSAGGGLKHIFAQFRSVTGQTNSPVAVDVNYITQGPVIQSFSLSDGQTLSRPLTVSGSATAVLGMRDLEFYLDGVGLATNAGGSFSYYFDVRPLANAVHQVELLARDAAGNIATLEEGVIVAVTPPLAPTITVPNSDYVTNNSRLTIRGTAEENIAIQVTDNGQVLGATTTDGNGNFSVANVTLSEGANTMVAVASDSTGSTASPARQVTVETIPPVALVMNQPVYNPGVGINLSWQFAASGKQASSFQVFWGANNFATTNQATGHSLPMSVMSYIAQGLANGTYYFGVVGFDAVGNPSPISGLVSIVYDGTPPSLSIAYGSPSPVGVGSLGVTLGSSKALAATPSLTIQPNGAASPALLALTNVALNTWQSAFTVTGSTPSGVATVLATARDQAGNVFNGAPAGPPLVIDTTPPTGTIATAPPGPVQTTNNTNVTVSLVLSKLAGPGTTPSLTFQPPAGANAVVVLSGVGSNWNGILSLTPAMGSGFGQFAFVAQDSVGNRGTNLVAGGQLELYNTALPSAPAAPTNLAAVSLPGGQVSLAWNAVGNAQIYRLYRETGTHFTLPGALDLDNITTNSVVDSPPTNGLYSYGISASRFGSESGISNVVVALSDRTPPPAPTNVLVQLAANGVQITWQEPSGQTPDHYNIYRNGAFLQSVSSIVPVTDYPPRGTDSYVVAAVDAIGNQNPSAAAAIVLLVGPVSNLSALVAPGQGPALSWTSSDSTVVGFNVYRNGVKQNPSLLSSPAYADGLPMVDVVRYGVSAVNGTGQESPQRVISVYPISLGLLVNPKGGNTNNPVLTGYFDQFTVSITNLSATAAVPLSQLVLNRAVAGTPPLVVTQALTGSITAGAARQQPIIVPEASASGAQVLQISALQPADSEGDSVTYQRTFAVTNSTVPATEIAVSVNQLPLAGGLTPFQVQIFNRAYVDLQLVVERANGQQPGDLYISVQDSSGQEFSRTPFQGAPPGSFFNSDGSVYVSIAAGSSLTVTVPNVLVPAALAGTTNTTFVAVAGAIYNQIGTPQQTVSGPLVGRMVSSLAQTPYYGTAQTDQSIYTNNQPVIISGQAINRMSGLPVPNAALNLGFATRGFAWDQPVSTDTNGNYQYVFNAPPGFGGTLSIWAANPLVVDQLNQARIVIDRVYANPSTGDIQMSKNGTLDFSIQLFNPGDVPLTGFTSSFNAYQVSGTNLTPLAKITGTNLNGSGFALEANQSQTINLGLAAAIDAPDSAEVVFAFTSAEGASATFTATVNLSPAVPVLAVAQPAAGYLEVSVNRGDQVSGQIVIVNNGLTDLQGVSLLPPTNSWISVNLPVSTNGSIALPDLPVGQSNSFSVVFGPPSALPLAFYQDAVTIQGANLSTPFQIPIAAIVTSDLTGGVQFFVDDILGEALSGAAIRLNNSLISANTGPFYTDTNGLVTITNLEEGTWSWQASAPGCSANSGTVDITADQTVYQHARLNRSLVTVNFSVVPVPFSDSYTVQITETYQTYVPLPVLVATPLVKEFDNVSPGFQASYNVTVQNQGLVKMSDLTLSTFQNGQASFQPLISYIPEVLPQQSIDVPYTVTYWGSNAPAHQGGNAGCLSVLGQYFTGPVPDFVTSFLLVADSILQAVGICPTDGTSVGLGVQAAANLYSTAEGLGFASPANQAAAMSAYLECVFGNVVTASLSQLAASYGINVPVNTQQSTPSFQTTGGGCLGANTRILMADGTEKLISELVTNDLVRSGVRKDNVAQVRQVYTVDDARVYELGLRRLRGEAVPSVLTTQEHLFWLDGKGWTPAKQLKPGDWLSNSQGAPLEIVANRPLARPMKVYTLRLRMDNAFYANGVLVHDLCGGTPPLTKVSTSEGAK
jgi:hypothetical protein